MKLQSFVVSFAIICVFKRFESLRSPYYNDTVRLLYEKLRITCLLNRIVVANALPEDLQISLRPRAFSSVFRTRRTFSTNLGYDILNRTGEAVDWCIRTVEGERCHFTLRTFILTLFNTLSFCPK
jgi:hypothetical protein